MRTIKRWSAKQYGRNLARNRRSWKTKLFAALLCLSCGTYPGRLMVYTR